MSKIGSLSLQRSLELVQRLAQTTSDFAQSEAQLATELSAKSNAATRKIREEAAKIEAQHAARTARINATIDAAIDRFTDHYNARVERFNKVAAEATQNVSGLAQKAKQKWMADLQLQHFLASRKQAQDQENAEKLLADNTAKLDKLRTTLDHLRLRARNSFSGYFTLVRALQRPSAPDQTPAQIAINQACGTFEKQLSTADELLSSFERLALPKAFRHFSLVSLAALILTGGLIAAAIGGAPVYQPTEAGVGGLLAFIIGLHFFGYTQSKKAALEIAKLLAEATQSHQQLCSLVSQQHKETCSRINLDHEQTCAAIQLQWDRAGEVEASLEEKARQKLDTQIPRIAKNLEALLEPGLQRFESEREHQLATEETEYQGEKAAQEEAGRLLRENLASREAVSWHEIEQEWKSAITPVFEAIRDLNSRVSTSFPEWSQAYVDSWTAPREYSSATQFAQCKLDLSAPPWVLPRDQRLALPGPSQISVPLCLTFPDQGSLLFETRDSGATQVIGTFNNLALRLLATTPPGKIDFTIIDPVGLGENFAGLMHLADYEESLINRRIWTQRDQIDERLGELSEHIEKVIQMYLRNEYASITEYNAQAGSVAEKYHFLVIADFPANFSESAAKRLQSILSSGPRCGIFTLIHWDQRQLLPDGLAPEDLRKNSICIQAKDDQLIFAADQGGINAHAKLVCDTPPPAELAQAFVHKIGQSSIDSNRVEVPFSQIAPSPEKFWTNDTTEELRIAIGRTGATKLQQLAIGKGTRQHALFAGKTGSGKSTLFHVIITNLALASSPDQVEFYLIDFKKGVEFKCYATHRLPHARVVAIESDREFALSVLHRVDEELKRRGDMFRKLGVQDLAGYKRAGGIEPVPRTLLIIDEFQEFFVEDDAIAQTASVLFDRIVRQGRAFGIHVLLGSQTLGGAYSLPRATLGQMVIRVALQCNEADAYLIMDDSNSAPRLLSRPGEGIYNDSAGAVEGNSPFQVVWLPDAERDSWLEKVQQMVSKTGRASNALIVFEGNAPADIQENLLLESLLERRPTQSPEAGRIWLGAPNSIKGPTEAIFRKQSGSNLLIVGQREESAQTMLAMGLIALSAQYPAGAVQFVVLQGNPGSSSQVLSRASQAIPHAIVLGNHSDAPRLIDELAKELQARARGEKTETPEIYLVIDGLQRFKKLRQEDDFSFSFGDSEQANPGAQLGELITEGPSHGIHLIVSIDTFNNVNRWINRKTLSEFEMRVIFQMSATDSASLIDSPKASGLGLHRALFYNEQEGHLETFRPYATPDPEWIRQAGGKLAL